MMKSLETRLLVSLFAGVALAQTQSKGSTPQTTQSGPMSNMPTMQGNQGGGMKNTRGAKVESPLADVATVVVTMHDQNGKYWVTDLKAVP